MEYRNRARNIGLRISRPGAVRIGWRYHAYATKPLATNIPHATIGPPLFAVAVFTTGRPFHNFVIRCAVPKFGQRRISVLVEGGEYLICQGNQIVGFKRPHRAPNESASATKRPIGGPLSRISPHTTTPSNRSNAARRDCFCAPRFLIRAHNIAVQSQRSAVRNFVDSEHVMVFRSTP